MVNKCFSEAPESYCLVCVDVAVFGVVVVIVVIVVFVVVVVVVVVIFDTHTLKIDGDAVS